MNDFGEMSEGGSVLSKTEMRERRKKRGRCETCGTKCFEKHLFKTIPITVDDEVLEGRCLRCFPLSPQDNTSMRSTTSQSSMKKSGRVSWRMGKLFRSNSDHSSLSAKSDEAICYKRGASESKLSSVTLTNTTIPVRIKYPEFIIEEEEGNASSKPVPKPANTIKAKPAENSTIYSQAIANAAGLQVQHDYRAHKPTGSKVGGQEQEALSSCTSSKHVLSTSSPSFSSLTHKQDEKDLNQKDIDVKESLRLNAREKSARLDERINKKLRNARISATPKQSGAIQPTVGKHITQAARKLDDNQILSKMEEQDCTYMDILDIATLHPSRLRVQQRAIHSLAQFELTESELTFILSSGRFKAIIVDGMDNFPNDKELQLDACYFLWNSSKTSDENKVAAARAGSIKATLNAMSKFPNDVKVQEIAVLVLSNICQVEEIQTNISKLDGVRIIVQAMTIHHKSISVQQSSCIALSHLAGHSYSMKTNINAERGCEQISIAMVENGSLGFLPKALRAICDICADHDENKISAINCGIIDSIVSVMQTHRDEAELQAVAAITFMNLGHSELTAPMIGENGGIDVMVRAMWLHSDNSDVQRSSCHSLYVLSVNTENQALIANVTGVAAIINAMQTNIDDADIQAHSCGILANVAQLDDTTRTQIVADEALDAITIAMVIHGDNVWVQDEACSVLQNLVCTSNLYPLQASNVTQLINSAATKFPAQCSEKALNFISNLPSDGKN